MRRRLSVFGLLAVSLLAAGCSLSADVTPPPSPAVVEAATTRPGAAIYAEHCAACHGGAGRGDGPLAAELLAQRNTPLPDFSAPEWVSAFDAAALYEVVTNGRLERLMPPWQAKLSNAERWAVVNYLGTLGQTTAVAAATPAAPDAGGERAGQVSGRVVNGTPGAAVPAGLVVVLHSFDNFAEVATVTTTTQADGAFAFHDLAAAAGRQYLLTTVHAELPYSSNVFNLDTGPQLDGVPLTIYDRTTDRAVLQVARWQITLAAPTATGLVQVEELIVLTNTSDQVFAPEAGPVFAVPLPAGASAIRVTNQRDGLDLTVAAQSVVLNSPVWPGQQVAQIALAFQLPAADPLMFEQPLPYPVAALAVWVPDNLTVASAQLQDLAMQTPPAAGQRGYGAVGQVDAAAIVFTVAGLVATDVRSAGATPALPGSYWLIGLAGLAVFLAGGAVGWYTWRPVPSHR